MDGSKDMDQEEIVKVEGYKMTDPWKCECGPNYCACLSGTCRCTPGRCKCEDGHGMAVLRDEKEKAAHEAALKAWRCGDELD